MGTNMAAPRVRRHFAIAIGMCSGLFLFGCGGRVEESPIATSVANAADTPAAKEPAAKKPAATPEAKPQKPPEVIRVKLTGKPLQDKYLLGVYENDELVRIERSEPVYLALLSRKGLDRKWRTEAIEGLAKLRKTTPLAELVAGLAYVDGNIEDGDIDDASVLDEVGKMLLARGAADLAKHRGALAEFVPNATRAQAKRIALAAIVTADGSTDKAWKFAEENSCAVDLLGGLPLVPSGKLRATLFEQAKLQLASAFDEAGRAACMAALASMEGSEAETFAILAEKTSDFEAGAAAVHAMLAVANKDAWPKDKLAPLADTLVAAIKDMPEADRNTPRGKDAVALTQELAKRAAETDRKRIDDALGELVVRTIELGTINEQMVYDKKVLVVRAKRPVQIVLTNHDSMPHNLVVLRVLGEDKCEARSTMEKVALAAEAQVRMAGAGEVNYVPSLDEVVAGSEMIAARSQGQFTFTAPEKPGIYPFICTFPGHWTKMYGALVVVDDLDAYLAANDPLPTAEKLLCMREVVKEYQPQEVLALLADVKSGRSFASGKEAFEKTANCMSCHRMNGKGGLIGPELTEVSKKYKPHEIAREMADPSKVINEKFAAVMIVVAGQPFQGLIVEETDKEWKLKPLDKILVDCEPTVISKDDFDETEDVFKKLETSLMPNDVLNILYEDEIKDLYAYILSGGDPKHAVFAK